MKHDVLVVFMVLACVIVTMAALVGGMFWLEAEKCEARWEKSGKAHSWKPIQGCMVQLNNGTWIPASAYRIVD